MDREFVYIFGSVRLASEAGIEWIQKKGVSILAEVNPLLEKFIHCCLFDLDVIPSSLLSHLYHYCHCYHAYYICYCYCLYFL